MNSQKSPRLQNNNVQILSPNSQKTVTEQYIQLPNPNRQNNQIPSSWSDKKQVPQKIDQEVIFDITEQDETETAAMKNKKDYEKHNQEMIQKMQEKKMWEQKMIEEERQKMIKRQEKLRKMILTEAANHRAKKEQEKAQQQQQDQQTLAPNSNKTPGKRKAASVPANNINEESNEEAEVQKKEFDMMKKYYRNRYASFLKAIQEQKKKKEQDLEEIKKIEERKKLKLKEEIVGNIQSRFMEDLTRTNKDEIEINKKRVEPKQSKGKNMKRGSSVAKTMASTSSFIAQKEEQNEIMKIYQQTQLPMKRDRSQSQSLKRALTPKIKKSKRVIVLGNQVIDEKDEEELQKELKTKKEAAEKIKQRQQKYLQEIQDRKEKEAKQQEEERKKKEKQKQIAREQAKQNFDKIQNQPGLKEQQDMSDKQDKIESDEENEESTHKKKKKQSKPESNIEAFIERNNPKRTAFPNITDLALWKKKFKVEENTKVFICTGGYPDIKKALKARGWVQNKDAQSPCFDFKWVLKARDIDHNILTDNQLVNHFNKAAAITTKVGLCHNLKNLIWFNNVDIDTFYPRCFDLAMQEELDDFVQEFKAVKAESYVKVFVREMRDTQGEKTTVSDKVLKTAIKVCEKRLKDLDDLIDDPNAFSSLVTDEEWKILGADELNIETLALKKHEDWLAKQQMDVYKKKEDKQGKKKKKKKKAKQSTDDQEQKPEEEEEGKQEEEEDDEEEADPDSKIAVKNPEFKKSLKILEELKKKYPQYSLNGENNIWIIKPAGSSRGRGIVLYKQLVEILDLVKQKESQYIAQKYIENTLIAKNRKFDIRQWVLVTDWNPLTVWLYSENYLRFSASDYSADNIIDKFIHLTNNSIGKYCENAKVSHEILGNMWDHGTFKEHLKEEYGWDVWEDKLREQTKNIVINTLESVQDMFECKKGCFELFGFDLMIDDEFNMWLIEVNSSPAMDYSTDVTERLVKMVLEDVVKVVVDYAGAKKKSKVDTGLFECIYKAKRIVDRPMKSFGLNLICEGKKIAHNKLVNY